MYLWEEHRLKVKDMILEQGALQRIPEFLQKDPYTQYRNFAMVCDDHTYEAAGKEVERLIRWIKVIKLNPENLHANEIGVHKVRKALEQMEGIDYLIAVGAGTIHDLTRYHAYEDQIPFISVPTADSVD